MVNADNKLNISFQCNVQDSFIMSVVDLGRNVVTRRLVAQILVANRTRIRLGRDVSIQRPQD